MTRIDQIIADALAGSPETHVAILAREVVRLREARAVVAPESDEVESLRDAVRFLASVVSKGAQIRHQIIFSLHENKPDEAKDYAMMKWPIIQGMQNQIDLEKVGKQAYTPKRIRLAVDSLLGIRANQGGSGHD